MPCSPHVGGVQLPAPTSTTGYLLPAQHPPQSSTNMGRYPSSLPTSTAAGVSHRLPSQAPTSSTYMGLSQPQNMRQPGTAGSTQAGPPPTHPGNVQAGPPPTHPSSTQAGPPPTHPSSTQAGPPPTHSGGTQAGPPPTHPGSVQAGPPPTHPGSVQAWPLPIGTGPPSAKQTLGRPPSGQLTGKLFMIMSTLCFAHVQVCTCIHVYAML